jgi:hypothetical protein
MLFVGDGAALAARVVCAALLAGVGAVDDPVCEDVQAAKSRAVIVRREIDLMTGGGGGRGKREGGSRNCKEAGFRVQERQLPGSGKQEAGRGTPSRVIPA